MRVLLTGITGLAGHAIASALLDEGHAVLALTRRPLEAEWTEIESLRGDLETLADIPAGIDAVIHAAALHSRRRFDALDFARVNVQGTANLLSCCRVRGVGRIVFLSTLSIHGRAGGPVLTEDTPCLDPDAYGLSKLLCEAMLADAAPETSSASLRLPGILGPGATDHWLAGLVGRASRGEPVRIFNPDARFNNAIHRDDLARFAVSLLRRDWRGAVPLNLACAGSMSIGEIAQRVVDAAGGRSVIELEERATTSFTVSTERAERMFGFDPRPFADALDLFLSDALG